jgi:beta-galactosidase
VGIRNVVLAHKQMLVNGCPVVLRGVNRHEHHPRLGKTNIEACMIKVDILLSHIGEHFITSSLWFNLIICPASGLYNLSICVRI